MKPKNLKYIYIIFTLLSIVLGTMFHFAFEFFNKNTFAAVFFPVNESVWEHLKLSTFPVYLLAIIEIFLGIDKMNNYLKAKAVEIIFPIFFIPIFFYSYSFLLGRNLLAIDIFSFIISIIIAKFLGYKILINKNKFKNILEYRYILVIVVLAFIVFTFNPLPIFLFKDSRNGLYGIF